MQKITGHGDSGTLVRAYTAVRRRTAPEGSAPAAKTLHRRALKGPRARLGHYLRIDRGVER
ncbi:hypothetical protein [Pontivivens ytuae]|uniref:Uncharacterized protein n=1 Tax=Pontivivens ytuae TaxID=2789856 RepID=A0A7S9LQC8_9RHOB|nr:hypothetical protein [Pontivivens ytuae]QPH52800.1 hypothetical protein I0K15_13385 [Pontivivens ytuae]